MFMGFFFIYMQNEQSEDIAENYDKHQELTTKTQVFNVHIDIVSHEKSLEMVICRTAFTKKTKKF